jgi:uncharacterized protein (DUF488 family)
MVLQAVTSNSKSTRIAKTPASAGTVFTIGHSTLPIDRFISVLNAYGIEELVDVRKIPRSRDKPQFGSEALEHELTAASIDYL